MHKSSSYHTSKASYSTGSHTDHQEPFFTQGLATPLVDENFSTNDQRIRYDHDIQEGYDQKVQQGLDEEAMSGRGKPSKQTAKQKPPADNPKPPHVTPQLSLHSGGMLNEGCGELEWDCGWNLSGDSGPKGGWVIQEVKSHYNAFDAMARSIPLPDGKKSPVHFFEAWRVEPNSTDMTPANIDTFKYRPRPKDGTSHGFGNYITQAVAYYHDNVGEDELPGHMVAHNPDTFAISLRSSLHDPKVGGDISGPVKHELAYHWTCLDKGTQPNIIDTQTPS